MIPLIEREVVTKKKWLKQENVSDMLTVSGSAPGAIAVNSAIFIGFRIAGIRGALASLAGVVMPSLFIVMLLSMLLFMFRGNPFVNSFFLGVYPAIAAMIIYAAVRVGKNGNY